MALPASPLMGQMMDCPLLISSIIEFAAKHYGSGEIVSRRVEGDIHRYTYRDCARRSRQLANALHALGVKMGDRVGTIAWNGYRHMEAYYGVSGSGAVLHTINPRLHPDQLAYILNHAEDTALMFDLTFLPAAEAIAAKCDKIRHWILMCDPDRMPASSSIPDLQCYETLIHAHSDQYLWPQFDENSAAALCYTSGTTGNPKGVLYSHRSTVLHAYAAALPNGMNVSSADVVLPVVPMFHVNAWSLPYSALLSGAKLVYPGAALDGKSLYELFESEQVTFSAGVPTVWLGLINYALENKLKFSTFRRTVIGGSACPPSMIDILLDEFDVKVIHAWGMTELSPLGTVCNLMGKHLTLPAADQRKILAKQGHGVYGIDMRIVDEEGKELPWDGVSFGQLQVKGAWVVRTYFKDEGGDPLVDGWFPTGDVATIDPDGFMQITDRSKDVIKSGGEWIGSIDIENIAMSHPAVLQAACIGVYHPKWDERPLLVVVKRPGQDIDSYTLLAHFTGKIAKWWMPDDVVFVDALPLGATGKVQKNKLRDQYRNHLLASPK